MFYVPTDVFDGQQMGAQYCFALSYHWKNAFQVKVWLRAGTNFILALFAASLTINNSEFVVRLKLVT